MSNSPSRSPETSPPVADQSAAEQAVYVGLRRAARWLRSRERPDLTMRTTGLVHEAYLALQKTGALGQGRGAGAFADASPDLYVRAMRRALVDASRRRGRAKRGGGVRPLSLSDRDVPAGGSGRDVEDRVHLAVDVDAALERLQRVDARACRVVELKFYGGLEDTQISEALGVTTRTVRRDWVKAQAHLRVFVGGRSTASRPVAA
ncbi:ECF-type sigma factor [Rubricoccus marinus]|uniref:RNA polymerase sigma-70 ECF-like HTH domain-containing protein n=1 Tax=Rubricoccus marinus TaxID=716817 RepID=A0A259TUA5_9BACT|nr:ECF-type sigma factor [Rubricoccus marinus]OZC01154.1 hypothetical protein BSZ36_18730 [Rubricoccus marinus]